MGPEVGMSGKFDISMEVSPVTIKENVGNVMLPEKLVVCASNREDHGFVDAVDIIPEGNAMMACASSYADDGFHMDVSAMDCDRGVESKGCNEDVEVEIVEDVVSDEEMRGESKSLDATENSSSFGCTDSGTEVAGASSDVEVESQVRDDNSSLMEFNGVSDLFRTRKKKLTAHWRKFIRPLMWRCKWVELQIRELRSQASKYDRELAEFDRRKQCELEKCAAEDLFMKSAPSLCPNRTVRVMKRKKRKRVEETADLAAYSSCHNLFSYFASKRSAGDSSYLDDDHGNTEKTSGVGEFGLIGEWSFLDFKDSDSYEDILRKIEIAQIHVRHLRFRIDKVVRENAKKSSIAPGEPLGSCGPSSIIPHENGETFSIGSLPTTSQQTSEKTVMPESVVFALKEVNPLDMIETTNQLLIDSKCGKIENKIGVYNQLVKNESNDTEVVGTQSIIDPNTGTEQTLENVHVTENPSSPSIVTGSREQLTVMPAIARSKLTTPKNKKKRGRRKARTGRWSRKSSG